MTKGDDSDNDNDSKNDKCHYDDNDDKDNDNDHWKWQDSTHSYLFSAEKRKKFVKTFLVVLFSWQWKAEVRRIKSGRSKKGETLCTLKLERKTNFLKKREKWIIELTMDEPDIFFAPPNPKKVLVINYNRQKRSSRGTGKAIRCSIMHKNPLKRG